MPSFEFLKGATEVLGEAGCFKSIAMRSMYDGNTSTTSHTTFSDVNDHVDEYQASEGRQGGRFLK